MAVMTVVKAKDQAEDRVCRQGMHMMCKVCGLSPLYLACNNLAAYAWRRVVVLCCVVLCDLISGGIHP